MEGQTKFKRFKSAIVNNAGKMVNWLWKSAKKKANDTAAWILTQKDKIINKLLSSKTVKLIESSNNSSQKNNTY